MIARRKAIMVLGAGALAPLASLARSRKVWRIGFLWESEQSAFIARFDAFKAGMSALGYVEGRDYVVEQRSARLDLATLPTLVAELVALKVDAIFASGTPTAVAASKATRDIPILIASVGDPVAAGLAASLARPGGNVTGLTNLSSELITKRLDLLRQILPRMHRVGFIYDPNIENDVLGLARFESDCGKLQLQAMRAPVRKVEEIVRAFATLARDKAQGLIVAASATNNALRGHIVETTLKQRLPAVFGRNDHAVAGGLISYAPDITDLWRRSAAYADRIFKGAKPGNLPIEQPTRFEMVVNMKSARAIGVTIPRSVLVQASQVIE